MSTELHAVSGSAATTAADAVVVGLLPADDAADPGGKGAPRLAPGADEVDAAFDGGEQADDHGVGGGGGGGPAHGVQFGGHGAPLRGGRRR